VPRLSVQDVSRVRELKRSLETWSVGDGSALGALLPQLRELLSAEKAAAYGVGRATAGFTMTFVEGSGFDPLRYKTAFNEWLKGRADGWTGYNPVRPEPRQRNVAVGLAQLKRITGGPPPIMQQMFPRLGLDHRDQLRVLICDGPSLLAWTGVFRPEQFTDRERLILTCLIPPLRQRLTLERQLGQSTLTETALNAALEAISSASFIVGSSGAVKHANTAGRALLKTQPEAGDWLRSIACDAREGRFSVTRLAVPGMPEHKLAVLRRPATDPRPRLTAATHWWELTAKQGHVLDWVVRGAANKTIAAALNCTEGTIELHVTALLLKAEAKSRAELVAKFWLEL
jgi:DNA-binding CsgD family transcriptional regulator